MSRKDSNICKVCGKSVSYWSVPKTNGKTRFYAFHEGDEVPEGSVKFEPDKISGIHKIRRRKELEEICGKTATISSSEVTSSKTKDVQVIETPVVSVPAESTIPEVSASDSGSDELVISDEPVIVGPKPVLDISAMKRNRFAITGAICQTMTQAGMSAQTIASARATLISNGKDFPSLINAAAPYVQMIENGQPISFN